MWRTVIVTQGEKLTIKDGWLVVYSDNNEQRVPIDDLYSVVIDNRSALISVNTIVALLAGEKLSSEKLLDTKDIIEL